MRVPLSLLIVLSTWSGCLEPTLGAGADLEPPGVEWLSLGDPAAAAPPLVDLVEEVTVRFSEPLDPWTVNEETVLVVAGVPQGSCRDQDGCPEGLCLEGTCVTRPVDQAFRDDANRPPLAASRRVRSVPLTVSLLATGREVRLGLRRPLERPQRYALVLSAALRDRAGNPLVSRDGREQGVAYEFVTAAPGAPRPEIRLLVPEPGATGVAVNLPEARVGVTGEVVGLEGDGIWLEADAGAVPTLVSRLPTGCPAAYHACYRLALAHGLAPSAPYRLRLDPGLRDREGRPVPGPGDVGFVTGAGADTTPPGVAGLEWAPEGGCLEVWFSTNEPTRARLRWQASGAAQEQVLEGFGTQHRGVIPLAPAPGTLEVEAWDAVGNRGGLGPVVLEVEALAPVAISEVLANPAGPEPAQEFVEIVNLGSAPISLEGWSLTDDLDKAGDPLPAGLLPAGELGLVVPSTYESAQPEDPAPAPGTVLLVLAGSTLGSAGLANGGEPVFLRDALGRVVSSYPGGAEDGAVPVDGQSVGRAVGQGCGARGAWRLQAGGTSTPGWLE